MLFSSLDHARGDTTGLGRWLGWVVGAVLLVVALLEADVFLRANGVYGERQHATVTVVDKLQTRRSRRGDSYRLVVDHRGQQRRLLVTAAEFSAVQRRQRLQVVFVDGWLNAPRGFIETGRIKHDPTTRTVMFGLIAGSHFGALLLLFIWLARRRERADSEAMAASGVPRRRLPKTVASVIGPAP
jgi:hypothetical protein